MSGREPSRSVNPYSSASCPELTDCWFQRARSGSDARRRPRGRRSAATPIPRSPAARSVPRLPVDRSSRASCPRRRRSLEHHLGPQPPGRDRHRGRAERRELVPLRVREPVHRDLRQVVVHRDPVVRRVVLRGAVGDLDHQPAGAVDEQREQVVRRDEVGVDREPEDPQAGVEVVLPDRGVPLVGSALQDLGAPDVVDQHVDVPVVVAGSARPAAAT